MNTQNILSPEHAQKLNEAFSRHLGEVMAAQEMMDEKQIFECFIQALLSGDFVKQVVQGSGAQNFIYQPFREVAELRRDKERLDWIENNYSILQLHTHSLQSTQCYLREAIDAAMSKST